MNQDKTQQMHEISQDDIQLLNLNCKCSDECINVSNDNLFFL